MKSYELRSISITKSLFLLYSYDSKSLEFFSEQKGQCG